MASRYSSPPFINVCNKELNIDEYHSVYDKVKSISASWKSFAISLRLRITDINTIEASSHGNAVSCLQKVIEHWLMKDYDYERFGSPSWRMVCVAVKEGGGNSGLADEIAREHSATTGGATPYSVGGPTDVIHNEGMSPLGGGDSSDNEKLSIDRRDASPNDDSMSPGSEKSRGTSSY